MRLIALRSFPNRYLFSLYSKVTSLFSIRYILEIIFKRDYFTVTAIGHAASGEEVGRSTFYLADYRDGKSSVVNTWEWFDWTPLANATYVTFEMESTDTGDYGMNTPNYFCLDGITLVEK